MSDQTLQFHQDPLSHLPLKIHLFARVNELKGILDSLDKVSQLQPAQRQAWLRENEFALPQMLHAYVHHLPADFDEDMDPQTMQLLFEYTDHLHELSRIVAALGKTVSRIGKRHPRHGN